MSDWINSEKGKRKNEDIKFIIMEYLNILLNFFFRKHKKRILSNIIIKKIAFTNLSIHVLFFLKI